MKEEPKEQGQTVTLPDGRKLGPLIVGEGKRVFYLYGFPGSRLEALCLRQMASSRHLQIIAVDLFDCIAHHCILWSKEDTNARFHILIEWPVEMNIRLQYNLRCIMSL